MMYDYDKRLSVILAQKYPDLIEERGCYNNVYRLVTEFVVELKPLDKLRVLYCYRKGPDGRYYRHAFTVFNGKLVEPLLYLDMSEENRKAIIPIREMSFDEYLDLLHEEKETTLRNTLYQADLDAVRSHGILKLLNPYDLANLYRKISEQ